MKTRENKTHAKFARSKVIYRTIVKFNRHRIFLQIIRLDTTQIRPYEPILHLNKNNTLADCKAS